jgi:hypothetical protein
MAAGGENQRAHRDRRGRAGDGPSLGQNMITRSAVRRGARELQPFRDSAAPPAQIGHTAVL